MTEETDSQPADLVPDLTAAQLTLLAESSTPETHAAVAAHPNTAAAVLGRLAADFPAEVLGNPALNLLRLAYPGLLDGWPTEGVLNMVASPQAPSWLRRSALTHADARFQVAVAAHPILNAHELMGLVHHPLWKVRARVAARSDLSQELMEVLLQDTDYGVRLVLAARADLQPDAMERLKQDVSLLVRQAMAQRE